MLAYITTPFSGLSPAELLMSHHLLANLPVTQSQLQPTIPDFSLLKAKEVEKKKNQKRVFNSQHAVNDLPYSTKLWWEKTLADLVDN